MLVLGHWTPNCHAALPANYLIHPKMGVLVLHALVPCNGLFLDVLPPNDDQAYQFSAISRNGRDAAATASECEQKPWFWHYYAIPAVKSELRTLLYTCYVLMF